VVALVDLLEGPRIALCRAKRQRLVRPHAAPISACRSTR
jgi:hypothetical protein